MELSDRILCSRIRIRSVCGTQARQDPRSGEQKEQNLARGSRSALEIPIGDPRTLRDLERNALATTLLLVRNILHQEPESLPGAF